MMSQTVSVGSMLLIVKDGFRRMSSMRPQNLETSRWDRLPFVGKSLRLIATPGHTTGSLVVVFGDSEQVLFGGDHFWWNWDKQIKSIEWLNYFDVI